MANQEQRRSVLLIGVPDAGKTNFIFRFWLRLDLGDGILKKAALPDDMEYLKSGADHLLKGEFAPHTAHDVTDRTEVPVRTTSEGHEFLGKVVVPDLPGEQTLTVFRSRQWTSHWEEEIRHGCGCLLFVRVDSNQLIVPIDWVNCPANFGAPMSHVEPAKDNTGKVIPPTQVVLVEWLQFLRKAFTAKVAGAYKPRIGMVVSAWDLAPNDQKADGPAAWVKGNLPLLWQFIGSNDEDFEFAYFAISVASGDLKGDESFKADYLKGDPRKAGEVVHNLNGTVEISSDVTLPVAWALGFPYASATASLY